MFQQMEFYAFKQIKIFLKFYWIWDLIEQTGSYFYHALFLNAVHVNLVSFMCNDYGCPNLCHEFFIF
jgi:hypothetical protein